MKTKHEKSFVDFDRTYETNVIGLRGIVIFAVGLFVLIVVTFGLMLVLQNVMEDQAAETKDTKSPMMMSERENLPPEPRLQGAPGFGMDSEQGRVNMELKAPQSEYREMERQWEKLWAEGQKDQKTGTIVTMPIDEAKRKFLEENMKTPGGETIEKSMDESRLIVSQSSAGRTATDKRR